MDKQATDVTRPPILIGLLLLVLLSCTDAEGPPPYSVIAAEPGCGVCRVDLHRLADVGDQDDEGMILSNWMALFALRGERWASMDAGDPGAIRVYGADGRFHHRVQARGQGPGEFMGVSHILPAFEGYVLYDRALGRLNWVTEEVAFLRSEAFPTTALDMRVLSSGDLVYNSVLPRHAARGHFLHIADPKGVWKVAFGGDGSPVGLRAGHHVVERVIEVTTEDRIWSSRSDRYELEEYSTSGELLRVLTRDVPWFPPDGGAHIPSDPENQPPNPRIVSVTVDSGGLLWVLAHVAAPTWRAAIDNRSHRSAIPDQDRYLQSVIEVIDPGSGELLSSARFPFALRPIQMASRLRGEALYFRAMETAAGYRARVLRARLTRNAELGGMQ